MSKGSKVFLILVIIIQIQLLMKLAKKLMIMY